MILDEFKDEWFELIPVCLFFFGNRDEIFAKKDMCDSIDSEQIASKR